MAGNYNKRKGGAQRSGSMFGQLLLVVVVFVAGYLTAAVYDMSSLTAWMSAHVFEKNSTQLIIKPAVQQAQLPKPKFEFYTVLANEKAGGGSSSAVAKQQGAASVPPVKSQPVPAPVVLTAQPVEHAPVTNAVASNESYMVQVASFKSMQEAERLKAALTLKGFGTKVVSSLQQNVNWYRVIIGPFASRTQAQQAQLAYARSEHVMGMIRKMDA